MTTFLIIRIVSFVVFVVATTWATTWILLRFEAWPLRFPRLLLSAHGAIYYFFYFLFLFSPALTFSTTPFQNWGALYIMHVAWYILFNQIEEDTRFFSSWLPSHFIKWVGKR